MTNPLGPKIGQQETLLQTPAAAPISGKEQINQSGSGRVRDMIARLQQKGPDLAGSRPTLSTRTAAQGQGGRVQEMAKRFGALASSQLQPKQAAKPDIRREEPLPQEAASTKLAGGEQSAAHAPSEPPVSSVEAPAKHEEPIPVHEVPVGEPKVEQQATPQAPQQSGETREDEATYVALLKKFKQERDEEKDRLGQEAAANRASRQETGEIASSAPQEPEVTTAQPDVLSELEKFTGLSQEELKSSTLENLVQIFSQQVPAETRRQLCLEILSGQHPELPDTLIGALLKSYPKPESAAAFQREVIEGTQAIVKRLGAHQTPDAIAKTMKQFGWYTKTMSQLISLEEMTAAQKQLNFPVQYFYTIQAEAEVLQKMATKNLDSKILNDKAQQVSGLTSWWNFQLEWLTSHPNVKYSSDERIAAMHSFLSQDPTNPVRLNTCLNQMLQFLGSGERLYREQKGFASTMMGQDELRDAAYIADCFLSSMPFRTPAEQVTLQAFAQTFSRPDVQAVANQTQDAALVQAFKLLNENPLFNHPASSARRHIGLVKPTMEHMDAFVHNKKPFHYTFESGKNERLRQLNDELQPLLDALRNPDACKDFVRVLGAERTNAFIGQLEKLKERVNFAEYQSKPQGNTTRQIREACDTTCQELINALRAAQA